jgi:dTMP kinase
MTRGLFIAFEGIDGCGKSTQVAKLAKHLLELDKHNHVLITRNPYKNTNIRAILRSEDNPYSQAEKLAKLFTDDRRQHFEELILPNIINNVNIITDRFSFSTLAYQHTQGMKLKKLIGMHRGIKIPDIIFIIDVPAEVAINRMKNDKIRKTEQKFEKNKQFIEKLRKNYLNLAKLPNHNVIIVNGIGSSEEIFEKQIKPAFDKFYSQSQNTIQKVVTQV